MNIFALNLILAIVWAGLWTDFSALQLVVGFHVGFAALWLVQPLFGTTSPYFRRAYRVVRLIVFFPLRTGGVVDPGGVGRADADRPIIARDPRDAAGCDIGS